MVDRFCILSSADVAIRSVEIVYLGSFALGFFPEIIRRPGLFPSMLLLFFPMCMSELEP